MARYYPAYTGPWTRSSFNGWDVSGSVRVFRHVGIEGDFGGLWGPTYGCTTCVFDEKNTIRTYMRGPASARTYEDWVCMGTPCSERRMLRAPLVWGAAEKPDSSRYY